MRLHSRRDRTVDVDFRGGGEDPAGVLLVEGIAVVVGALVLAMIEMLGELVTDHRSCGGGQPCPDQPGA